jgi:uncharacterized protein YpmS
MRWLRRILLLVAILLCGLIAAAGTGAYLYRTRPSWYHVSALSPTEQQDVQNQAQQKLAEVISWAASVQARQVRQTLGTASASDQPIAPLNVTVSEDELNSFFDAWDSPDKKHFQERLQRYFSNGQLDLWDGRIILAADSKDLGTLASVQLQPRVDEQGKLQLQWEGVSAGMLPVPQAIVGPQMQRLQDLLRGEMSTWQKSAAIDQTCVANMAAVQMAAGRLLLDSMNGQASQPMVFLPFDLSDPHHTVAVRVGGIDVGNRSMTMTLEPLTGSEAAGMLQQIKGSDAAPASASP